jgi:hypothetical protein
VVQSYNFIERSIRYAREPLASLTRGVPPDKTVSIHARSMFCPVRMTAARRPCSSARSFISAAKAAAPAPSAQFVGRAIDGPDRFGASGPWLRRLNSTVCVFGSSRSLGFNSINVSLFVGTLDDVRRWCEYQ